MGCLSRKSKEKNIGFYEESKGNVCFSQKVRGIFVKKDKACKGDHVMVHLLVGTFSLEHSIAG